MDALLVVDVQNDFMPFGSLPVTDGDAVVAVANRLMRRFDLVVATQDWHPHDHGSFASNHPGANVGDIVDLNGVSQVLWPDHCVQNTPGASFHSALDVARIDHVVCKGVDRGIDSYSAFFDNAHRRDTGLRDLLGAEGVDRVVIVGLATDYCVLFTAMDARDVGLDVVVVSDGVRAVNLEPFDDERAFEEMRKVGCVVADQLNALGAVPPDTERPPRGAFAAVVHSCGRGPCGERWCDGESSGEGGFAGLEQLAKAGHCVLCVIQSPVLCGQEELRVEHHPHRFDQLDDRVEQVVALDEQAASGWGSRNPRCEGSG